MAGATKLLARFRPGLIPVIDSVVEDYLWFSTSIRHENRFRDLQRAWNRAPKGDYIFLLLELLRDDLRGALQGIDKVLEACASESFANASRVRVVESLIWFYYAGGA